MPTDRRPTFSPSVFLRVFFPSSIHRVCLFDACWPLFFSPPRKIASDVFDWTSAASHNVESEAFGLFKHHPLWRSSSPKTDEVFWLDRLHTKLGGHLIRLIYCFFLFSLMAIGVFFLWFNGRLACTVRGEVGWIWIYKMQSLVGWAEYMQSGWIRSPPIWPCACVSGRWWISFFENIFLLEKRREKERIKEKKMKFKIAGGRCYIV